MNLVGRLFVPVAFIAFAMLFLASSWHLDFRSIAFPYLAIMVITALGGVAILSEVLAWWREPTVSREVSEGSEEASQRRRRLSRTYKQPALTVLLLVAYVYLIRDLGFYVTTFVFLLLSSLVIGISWRRIPILLVIMSGITAFCYIFFEVLLKIPLP